MTVASEVTKLNTNLTNAYTAVDGKGGTLPQAQNFDNLATAISTIPSGGGIGIPREVKNGVYQQPTESFTFSLPSDATDVGKYGLYYAFANCTSLTSVDLLSLITVSGSSGLRGAFQGTGLTSVDLSSLTTVSGNEGLAYIFRNCTTLTSVDLSLLTTVSGSYGLNYAFSECKRLMSINLSSLSIVSGSYGLDDAFNNCTGLTSVDLSSLNMISSCGLQRAFTSCTALTDIYFRALTTSSFGSYKNQFTNMMFNTGKTTTHTIHFPSNMESTISTLSGYPLFGGTSGKVVCAFDLPATS